MMKPQTRTIQNHNPRLTPVVGSSYNGGTGVMVGAATELRSETRCHQVRGWYSCSDCTTCLRIYILKSEFGLGGDGGRGGRWWFFLVREMGDEALVRESFQVEIESLEAIKRQTKFKSNIDTRQYTIND